MNLQGRVAIVTGAGSGIGAATVGLFLKSGASVVAFDRNSGGLEKLSSTSASGDRLAIIAGDVTSEPDLSTAIQLAGDRFGALHILVNNAGMELGMRPIQEVSLADVEQLMRVNVLGVYAGMKLAVPAMIAAGGGTVVNTGSVAGLIGVPLQIAYSASKGAVINMTRAAAAELGPQGIRVNCVAPGAIKTPFFDSVLASRPEAAALESATPRMALPRIGTPEEVASVIGFLASDDARFVTGAVYTVDGGYTAA